ncbi:5-dehydro-2-deoxygluconokinase [Micromonospora pallida]|uniref:5-dehydro-2-deoxygluconokinase n=1 Tax=Micromonospora pallida TaxID=145854 RepID=A0A1C6SH61_9ACTN|nr:DUF2090 domain-containing protein [Micromonospora pallida]SCL28834.1 5-dehydro-2-deoxygluconokinase [Micromonospora pallida]
MSTLYMLAFDHRASLTKMFGEHGGTYQGRPVDYSALKRVIWESLPLAIEARGLQRSTLGVLVDEEYGADVAREVAGAGLLLAMPAERSLQRVFELEYGDQFDVHIEAFDPDHVKVLAIADETLPADLLAVSMSRLRQLSEWVSPRRQRLMLELLVLPSAEQLAQVGDDRERFDTELRPQIMVDTIRAYQQAGIEADIWKVEGLTTVDDYQAVAAQARADGRDDVECIVLGRGADDAQILRWLHAAGQADGFTGFAIGRSTWAPSLEGLMAGRLDPEQARAEIAGRFVSYVNAFEGRTGDLP